ncbi:MAG TPA: alpha/beta hydrolase [Polyangiales bacterium]|nr:alpha/beta hydrolase [Polyangiales bacterium]
MSLEGQPTAIPEGEYADIGEGRRIHYHAAGSGTPVVFIHGSGPGASGYSNFQGNFPFFAERGFRVIVPDSLGFGLSSKPDVDYELDYVLAGLKALLQSLGVERCAVVGNSHGGALAIQLALDEPQLVSKLILMAPGGLEVRERYLEQRGIRSMFKAVSAPEGITPESLRKVLTLQVFDSQLITEALVTQRWQIAQLQPKRLFTTLRVPHLAPRLAELTCPVLGLWGNDDQFCPVSGAAILSEQCRDSRVVRLSRCGHWVMVERAPLFNQLCTEFLRE